jgi:hypothetical protein
MKRLYGISIRVTLLAGFGVAQSRSRFRSPRILRRAILNARGGVTSSALSLLQMGASRIPLCSFEELLQVKPFIPSIPAQIMAGASISDHGTLVLK